MRLECEQTTVKIIGRTAVIRTRSGAKALVPLEKLCDYATRYKLCLENYKCEQH